MTSVSKKSGVLFDLDETLIDRAGSIRAYAGLFWSEHAQKLGVTQAVFIDHFIELDGNGYVPRPDFFQALAVAYPQVGLDARQIEHHYFTRIWESPMVVEGAREGLEALRVLGVPLGIVSNGGSVNQRRKLSNTGLGDLVDGVFISEEVGVKKPGVEIFETACSGIGITRNRSWFVGDHPWLDICGSAALGMKSIWVRRALSWPEAEPHCYELAVDELKTAMQHLQNEFACSSVQESEEGDHGR